MPKLMLVDDDLAVRSVLREYVETYAPNFQVIAEAGNGAVAVELASQHKPDVILMDIRMPVLDGIAATKRIVQEMQLPCKVVTYTSYAYPELEREARAAGASNHLRKPFSLDVLGQMLCEAVGQ